ncbi:uridine kinase-like protein [Fadolivirus algeromassiliense]|jgi:uridine kinase|uniref:uridine/cytidine kinase n=1 Tax=Fadolivirus FV1/VV64 TaxID=3070911 RepID=A0A7D3R2B5_9VIRU|nr:uridine kinase-like protein [Fadolivirus algeromassiliense]QKF94378.1 uridine kinase-like protein [Fadolivirus FV1/VV64]
MESCYVIGVCGPTCGGKTTVCHKILEKIAEIIGNREGMICIVSQDSYYNGGNVETNYDVPAAIDFDLMVKDLKQLISGKSVNAPIYDFKTHSRKTETRKIGPAKIIIVEGILIFSQREVRDLCNLRIFVEADNVICYTRRLKRDVMERGRSFDEVEKRYLEHVVPSFNEYINPSRFYANIVLINNTNGEFVGLEILLDHIEKKITQFQ